MAITNLNTLDPIADAWVDAVQNNIGNPWVDWSSSLTWFGSGGNPTKGNSTYIARYRQLNDHTVAWTIFITVGSLFVAGTGSWSFSLPVAPVDANGYGQTGVMWANDSGVKLMGMFYDIEGSNVTVFRMSSTGTTPWSATNLTFADWTPNTGDSFKMSGIYEV